jgi:DNA polymerase V
MTDAVFDKTGITAAAGVGTNLFLAKVALDISAKHSADGLAFLDEETFSRTVAYHRPITDIWNIGRVIANRLERYGIYDLKGVAECSEQLLYNEFGVNAEFLIDHANGREPCTIKEIHEYKPKSSSISNGQVLFEDYSFDDAFTIVKEMVDLQVDELIEKHFVIDSISLHIGYFSNFPIGKFFLTFWGVLWYPIVCGDCGQCSASPHIFYWMNIIQDFFTICGIGDF